MPSSSVAVHHAGRDETAEAAAAAAVNDALKDEFALRFCWAVGEHFVQEFEVGDSDGDGGGGAGSGCRRRYLDILAQTLTRAAAVLDDDGVGESSSTSMSTDRPPPPPRDARLACAAMTAMCKIASVDWDDSAPFVRGCLRRVLAGTSGTGTSGTGTSGTGTSGTSTSGTATSGTGTEARQRWVYGRAAEALAALESRRLAQRCWSRREAGHSDHGYGGDRSKTQIRVDKQQDIETALAACPYVA